MKHTSILIVIMLLFILFMAVLGVMAKGVKAGQVSPRTIAGTAMLIGAAIAVSLLAALIRLFRNHINHTKQASSAEILADIMAMKDKNDKEE